MKENNQIYLPYKFHWRPQSAGWDSQLPHKKMKTLFLSNMSKSRRLTSTFFPISQRQPRINLNAYGHWLFCRSVTQTCNNQHGTCAGFSDLLWFQSIVDNLYSGVIASAQVTDRRLALNLTICSSYSNCNSVCLFFWPSMLGNVHMRWGWFLAGVG